MGESCCQQRGDHSRFAEYALESEVPCSGRRRALPQQRSPPEDKCKRPLGPAASCHSMSLRQAGYNSSSAARSLSDSEPNMLDKADSPLEDDVSSEDDESVSGGLSVLSSIGRSRFLAEASKV